MVSDNHKRTSLCFDIKATTAKPYSLGTAAKIIRPLLRFHLSSNPQVTLQGSQIAESEFSQICLEKLKPFSEHDRTCRRPFRHKEALGCYDEKQEATTSLKTKVAKERGCHSSSSFIVLPGISS